MKYKYTTPRAPFCAQYKKITEATHLLIAGTTGSGKSCLLSSLIAHLMMFKTPASARLVLIDPKRIDLRKFKDVSDFCDVYANTSVAALNALKTVSAVMERRYIALENSDAESWSGAQIYVIIDELADLMISEYAKDIKRELQHITQLGRAAGIHVWAATQAPSRKIIPPEIVLNFTDRVALRCVSAIESRQILQVSGAENLPRYGSAIYFSPDGIQQIALPLYDYKSIINYWKENPRVAV